MAGNAKNHNEGKIMKADKTAVTTNKNKTLQITKDEEKTKAQQLAEISLSATATNGILVHSFNERSLGPTSLTETVERLREKIAKVHNGNLADLEETLTAQASSLNAIYCDLAKRAAQADTMFKLQVFMRMSLKAQAQCARTIEVLAALKNPPVVFAKQANITSGPQQVNNGDFPRSTHAHTHAHGEKIQN